MAVYKFRGKVGDDHLLELPPEIPPGRAEIVVVMDSGTAAAGSGDFQAVVREILRTPSCNRSKADIDLELRIERESWE